MYDGEKLQFLFLNYPEMIFGSLSFSALGKPFQEVKNSSNPKITPGVGYPNLLKSSPGL